MVPAAIPVQALCVDSGSPSLHACTAGFSGFRLFYHSGSDTLIQRFHWGLPDYVTPKTLSCINSWRPAADSPGGRESQTM
ncbi:hypothetical protein GDO78_019077 [Eleutherodactylus coqui]|uniref:Uncharacterized protein n=1 Tax=Eleutherodactylus coqui TaxID=57060 RepID=A0A8J6ENY0_ELECQ|nr:hypothetical protein GDO78_019077 [Eleutherodactylus coqui]